MRTATKQKTMKAKQLLFSIPSLTFNSNVNLFCLVRKIKKEKVNQPIFQLQTFCSRQL